MAKLGKVASLLSLFSGSHVLLLHPQHLIKNFEYILINTILQLSSEIEEGVGRRNWGGGSGEEAEGRRER